MCYLCWISQHITCCSSFPQCWDFNDKVWNTSRTLKNYVNFLFMHYALNCQSDEESEHQKRKLSSWWAVNCTASRKWCLTLLTGILHELVTQVSSTTPHHTYSPVSCCVHKHTKRSVSQQTPSLCRAAGLQGQAVWTDSTAPGHKMHHHVRHTAVGDSWRQHNYILRFIYIPGHTDHRWTFNQEATFSDIIKDRRDTVTLRLMFYVFLLKTVDMKWSLHVSCLVPAELLTKSMGTKGEWMRVCRVFCLHRMFPLTWTWT